MPRRILDMTGSFKRFKISMKQSKTGSFPFSKNTSNDN